MTEMVHRAVGVHLRSFNEEARSIDVVMSTDAIDSYEERVAQDWDLKRFKTNPIVLWAHNSRELPLGRAVNVKMKDGQLECSVVFASKEANPMAEQVFRLFQEGVLKAVSVGFVPRSVKYEKENDKEIAVLSDNELHELSIVPIPANPEALAKSIADAARIAAPKASAALRSETEKSHMDPKEEKALRDLVAQREAEVTSTKAAQTIAEKALADERVKTAALETQNKTLVEERDAAKAASEKSAIGIIERDVDALVGVKILPAEKDLFVELAKSNADLFAKMVAQRSPLKLLGGPVVGEDPIPVPDFSGKDASDALVDAAFAAADS